MAAMIPEMYPFLVSSAILFVSENRQGYCIKYESEYGK